LRSGSGEHAQTAHEQGAGSVAREPPCCLPEGMRKRWHTGTRAAGLV
jgi:hypothetical protein